MDIYSSPLRFHTHLKSNGICIAEMQTINNTRTREHPTYTGERNIEGDRKQIHTCFHSGEIYKTVKLRNVSDLSFVQGKKTR